MGAKGHALNLPCGILRVNICEYAVIAIIFQSRDQIIYQWLWEKRRYSTFTSSDHVFGKWPFCVSMHPSEPKMLAERGSDQHAFCSFDSKKSGSMRKMNYQDAPAH